MGANKVFLIKLFNNFMERILIAIRIGGGGESAPHFKKWRGPSHPDSLPLINVAPNNWGYYLLIDKSLTMSFMLF